MTLDKTVSEYCCVIGCGKKTALVRAISQYKIHDLICSLPLCKEHLKWVNQSLHKQQ